MRNAGLADEHIHRGGIYRRYDRPITQCSTAKLGCDRHVERLRRTRQNRISGDLALKPVVFCDRVRQQPSRGCGKFLERAYHALDPATHEFLQSCVDLFLVLSDTDT